MPLYLFLVQIALPGAVLLWLAAAPAQHRVFYRIQVVATATILLCVALVAPWAMPPWWTPYLYGAILVGVVARTLSCRSPQARDMPIPRFGVVALLPLVGLALFGGFLSLQALSGHSLPEGETLRIRTPLSKGRFIVENGGSTLAVNGHLHAADPSDPLHDTANGQSRALDIIPIDSFGLRSLQFWPSDPAAYVGFGHPVLAPCDGTVTTAIDGHPDQRVPRQDHSAPAGNHVVITCGDARVVLAHLRMRSVAVESGDRVRSGTLIGEIGNSGASTEPHLHIHAERPSPMAGEPTGEPIWLIVEGRFLARNDTFNVQ